MEVDVDTEVGPSGSTSVGAIEELLQDLDELASDNESSHQIQMGDGEVMKRFRSKRVNFARFSMFRQLNFEPGRSAPPMGAAPRCICSGIRWS
ncbi:hypothetical protein CPB83DRAFT_865484 [Crepidotus variabilis]|uniref:Uncharacterized protein n=1 Tax=Crepidotus variabilis TaxID=179855 RepID=A0A9P6BBY4_9AGAR|nr:hypothetical protein CPB83DRAFT_865484 [Crepidotus variabilis]